MSESVTVKFTSSGKKYYEKKVGNKTFSSTSRRSVVRNSNRASSSSSGSKRLIKTTIRTGGSVISGYHDTRTGKFIPRASNKKEFETLTKQLGTNNYNSIEKSLGSSKNKRIMKENKEAATSNRLYSNNFNYYVNNYKKIGAASLKKKGLTMTQINKIQRAYEVGQPLGEASLKKLKEYREKHKTFISDGATGERIFKAGVNQNLKQLGFNTLSSKKSVNEFVKAQDHAFSKYDQHKKLYSGIKSPSLNKTGTLKEEDLKLNRMVSNGESMTPTQIKRWQTMNKVSNKEFTKASIDFLINNSPVKYGMNLGDRALKGEKAPFLNDVKSFASGFYDTAGKPIIRGSTIALKSAYNYGKNLHKRHINQKVTINEIVRDDVALLLKKIGVASVSGAKFTAKAVRYAYNNPVEAAAISGAIVTALGRNINLSVGQSFEKNPARFFGQVVGMFAGFKTISLAVKSTGKLANVVFTGTSKILPKTMAIKWDVLSKISKSNTKLTGIISGKLTNNKSFTGVVRIALKNKQSLVSIQIKQGKQIINKSFRLIKEGGYWINKKYNMKIKSTTLDLKNIRSKVTEVLTRTLNTQKQFNLKSGSMNKITTKATTTTKVKAVGKSAGARVKTTVIKTNKTNTATLTKSVTGKKVEITIAKKAKVDNVLKFYADGSILKRTGMTKAQAESFYVYLHKELLKEKILSKFKTAGSKVNKLIQKSVDHSMKIGKKATVGLSPVKQKGYGLPVQKQLQKVSKVKAKVKISPSTNVYIPDLKKIIYFPAKLTFKIPVAILNTSFGLSLVRAYGFKTRNDYFKKTQTKTLQSQTKVSKFSKISKTQTKTKQVSKQKQTSNTKQKQLSKQKVSQVTKPSTSTKTSTTTSTKVSNASITPKPPKIKKPIKGIPLNFGSKSFSKDGKRLAVDVYMRKNKKNSKIASRLPINKGWNYGYNKVNNSLSRSYQLKIVGMTKTKDDPRRLGQGKLRKKMSSNKQVLNIVEKISGALDTKGEKFSLLKSKYSKRKK